MTAARSMYVCLSIALVGAAWLGAASCSKSDGAAPNPTVDAGDAGLVEAAPSQPPGCFSGTPSQPLDFLNACTDADFVVFDNCARLSLCDGGALPDRVAPPPLDFGVSD